MSVEFFVALRYLKARKKGLFSVLTAFISIGGTTLGVAALTITLAVMSGFQSDIRNKILGIQPHIILAKVDGESFNDYPEIENKIKNKGNILRVSPYIYRQGIVRTSETTLGILIKAVNFEKENKSLNLSKQIVEEEKTFDYKKVGSKKIILGSELAKTLFAECGDEIILMFPTDFTSIPKMYKYVVTAILNSGMYDFDSSLGLIDLEEGQKLFSMEHEVSGLDVYVANADKALNEAKSLQDFLGYSYRATAWMELNKNLFAALKLEKIMMFLILALIILVAAFNIVSNLLLLSSQKSKEIGIMSALGFSKFSIAKIFFYEGIFIGFTGVILGIAAGLTISFALKYFDFFKLPQGVYFVEKLPIAVIPFDIVMVAASALLISVFAGLYPAYRVSKLDPLEAIRYG
jgi:lipoprotein-releasing system permease protein